RRTERLSDTGRRIFDSEAAADDRLLEGLVGEPEARSEAPRVILGERAMTGRLVSDRARMAASGGIRQVGREVRRTAVLLLVPGRVVIAQPEIQGQLARYFPAVLRIRSPLLFSKADSRRRV